MSYAPSPLAEGLHEQSRRVATQIAAVGCRGGVDGKLNIQEDDKSVMFEMHHASMTVNGTAARRNNSV